MAIAVQAYASEEISECWLYERGFTTPYGGGFIKQDLFLWKNEFNNWFVRVSGVNKSLHTRGDVLNLCSALRING